jgi:hypothetical protein
MALRDEPIVPDRVHASVDDAKAPDRDPVVDVVFAEAEAPQLLAGDDAVLTRRECRDEVVKGTRATWTVTIAVNVERVRHRPERLAARVTERLRT